MLLVAGLAGVGTGGFAVFHELTRAPTKAELAAASKAEIARRWRELPAGKIFPGTVKYTYTFTDDVEGDQITETAHLVGIAPRTTCAAAAGGSASAVLRKDHCRTVLRATYTDSSGALLATVGVVVMRSDADALRAQYDLSNPVHDIHPVRFGGTVANGFTDSGVTYSRSSALGPYAVVDVSGYADDRHGDITAF
ncbi:MAG: hypothetical protein ACM3ML_09940 [Micromonosporaceae bacterium]